LLLLPFPLAQIEIIEDGTVVIGHDGRIKLVGTDAQVQKALEKDATFEHRIDATGKAVIPGLFPFFFSLPPSSPVFLSQFSANFLYFSFLLAQVSLMLTLTLFGPAIAFTSSR
jgi:hypothetical protein